MNPLNIKIGQIIREKREKKNLTQLDVAKLLGYQSTQFVSLFERGLSKCPPNVLGKLAIILEIPKSKFVDMLTKDYKERIESEMRPI